MNRFQATNEEGRKVLTVCSPLLTATPGNVGPWNAVGRQYCPFPRVLAITTHTGKLGWLLHLNGATGFLQENKPKTTCFTRMLPISQHFWAFFLEAPLLRNPDVFSGLFRHPACGRPQCGSPGAAASPPWRNASARGPDLGCGPQKTLVERQRTRRLRFFAEKKQQHLKLLVPQTN